ncbi:MAG: tetratricopeptide repeat protein [Puniceicoccaceae bacterium]
MGLLKPALSALIILLMPTLGMHADSPEQEWTVESIRSQLEIVEDLRGQGKYDEGLQLAQSLHDAATELSEVKLELEARYQISLLHYYKQDFDEARTSLKIGITKAGMEGLDALKADFLTAEGVLEWKQGNLSIATQKLVDALEMHRGNGQILSMISTTNNLGIIAYSQKDYLGAAGYYRLGLEWLGDMDNDRLRASLTSNLAETLIPLNQLEEAEVWLNQSLELEEKLGEPQGLAYTYLNFGELRSKQGNHDAAIRHYNKALRLQNEIGDEWGACLTQLRRGREFAELGETEMALGVLNKGIENARSLNALTILADYANELQELHRELGDEGKATYFHDLGDWLKVRMQAESELALNTDVVDSEAAGEPEESTATGVPIVQIIALVIIAGLIATLLVENMRLRKKARSL